MVDLLSQQGFMAAWSADHGAFKLAEHNCAVRAAAERFPEICAAEAEFFSEVLQREVQRDSYIPAGCNACEYSIGSNDREPDPAEPSADTRPEER